MNIFIRRVVKRISEKQHWNNLIAWVIAIASISILWFVSLVAYKTMYTPNEIKMITGISATTSEINGDYYLQYQFTARSVDEITGRLDKQLKCDNAEIDLSDSTIVFREGENNYVRKFFIPALLIKSKHCSLEIAISRSVPFSIANPRLVLSKTEFKVN